MAALAWTLKARLALRLPTGARYAAEKATVLRVEFEAVLQALMLINSLGQSVG